MNESVEEIRREMIVKFDGGKGCFGGLVVIS